MYGTRDFITWSLALGGVYDQCRLEKLISIVYVYLYTEVYVL